MPEHTTNQTERSIVEDNIIKDIRNLFRLEKKKNIGINDKLFRDINETPTMYLKSDNIEIRKLT